jgi:hypothetical protein
MLTKEIQSILLWHSDLHERHLPQTKAGEEILGQLVWYDGLRPRSRSGKGQLQDWSNELSTEKDKLRYCSYAEPHTLSRRHMHFALR